MDFTKLVIDGYRDHKDLPSYFYREYKKAQRDEFFGDETFFNSCNEATKTLKKYIQQEYQKRKNEINQFRNHYKNYSAAKLENESEESFKQRCNERVKQMDEETEALDLKSILFNLREIQAQEAGLDINSIEFNFIEKGEKPAEPNFFIRISDVEIMEKAIQEAKNKITNEKQNQSTNIFHSDLNTSCLTAIYTYLVKKLLVTSQSNWLAWFGRKEVRKKKQMKWESSPTMLANVIKKICGSENVPVSLNAFDKKVGSPDRANKFQNSAVGIAIDNIIQKHS